MATTTIPAQRAKQAPRRALGNAKAIKPPPFQPVQLATLVDTVPSGRRWLHEMKYDGYRLLVAVGSFEARAYTRSGLDWSDRFGEIVKEAAGLGVRSALIDGEAVVMDEAGRSNFQALQGAVKGAPSSIDFIAFDLLQLDGEDLTGLPLTERKRPSYARSCPRAATASVTQTTSRATARSCLTASARPGSRA